MDSKEGPTKRTIAFAAACAAVSLSLPAHAEPQQVKASNAERLQRQALTDVPTCSPKLSTLSIVDGDDPSG